MKRMMIGALAGILWLGTPPAAHAAPKKKAKAAQQVKQEAPQSAEISKAMGDLKWGMSRDEVMASFMNAIKEKYKPLLAKSTGAIEEDKLRAKMRDELQRIRSSLVEFNGTKTGADVGFLKGEFTHHNHESMFKVADETSENYYFFINGKLWKWYKALNASAVKGANFDKFAEAIQGRYGKAQLREGEIQAGVGKQRWLEWQDPSTQLRAVDNNQFYGFYCLVFESKETVARLAELRSNKPDEGKKTNAMVEAVTSGEDEGASDDNKDVIDRITGNIRVRQDGPEVKQRKTASADAPASSTPAPASTPTKADDDPLKGLL